MVPLPYVRPILAAALLSLSASASLQGSFPERRTMYLTFNAPVMLPGVTLAADTYVFELADPRIDQSIVRVLSKDRSTMYFMALTQLIPRPPDLKREAVASFGEAAPGRPVPITAWYPVGDSSGRRFIYRNDR